jgi:hypothetical protein
MTYPGSRTNWAARHWPERTNCFSELIYVRYMVSAILNMSNLLLASEALGDRSLGTARVGDCHEISIR